MPTGKQTLHELVSQNFQYAAVLDKFGILFCEHPAHTLLQACKQKGLPLSSVLKNLENLEHAGSQSVEYLSDLSAELIMEYLRHAHTVFLKDKLPYFARLVQHLDAGAVPIARDLQILFPLFAEDFIGHIHEEEDSLFIYIQQLCLAGKQAQGLGKLFFTMEKHSISHFADAHETHDDEMQGIREITKNYELPEDASLLWQVVYTELQAFETELKTHAHIENNLLFPKALQLEKSAREKIVQVSFYN